MKRKLAIASILAIGALHAQQWEQLPDFPGTARDDAASFVIDPVTFVGTGMEVGWGLTNDWWKFDGEAFSWQQVAPLPATPRQYCSGFTANDKGYLFGGLDATGALNELWQYDPVTDQWTQMAPMPAEPRYAAAAYSDGNRGYIVTGMLGSGTPTNEFWRYDPMSNSWTQLPNAPIAPRHRVAHGGNKVSGGMGADGVVLSDAWEIDVSPAVPNWWQLADLPAPRFGAGANFRLLVGGASSWTDFNDDTWAYDNNTWTPLGQFPGGARKGGVTGAYCCLGYMMFYGLGLDETSTRRNDWWGILLDSGVEEHSHSTIRVWPNPATDELNVVAAAGARNTRYVITDATGRAVLEGSTPVGASIGIATLLAGSYSIVVHIGSSYSRSSFIKLP